MIESRIYSKLSLLSAAVLMALAASDSNANNANAAKTHYGPQTGGSKAKIAQIHRHPQSEKTASNYSQMRHSAGGRISLANHGIAHSNRGTGTVLYDQTASLTSNGTPAINCTTRAKASGC